MKIIIVTNGNLSQKLLPAIKSGDFIIGVDRAAYWLLKNGITPDVAVGDFDSVTKEEFVYIQKNVQDIRSEPPHPKYETDTEVAVRLAMEKKPTEVIIVGGVGSRFDHVLGTVSLLERLERRKIKASIVDEHNVIQLLLRGRTILKRGEYSYVSLIPYSRKIIVSLTGFKYEIDHVAVAQGQTLGISNEFASNEAIVELHSGKALVIESRD